MRFARAKGSKASNEKLPENATPWSEIKEQMLVKHVQEHEAQARNASELKRKANYDEFLQTSIDDKLKISSWANFSSTTSPKKRKANGGHALPEKSTDIETTKIGLVQSSASINVSKKDTKVASNSTKLKTKQKKRQKGTEVNEQTQEDKMADNPKKKKANISGGNKKKKKQSPENAKKPLEELTAVELGKIAKKQAKKRKQAEKRSLKIKSHSRSDDAKSTKNRDNMDHKRRKPMDNGTMKIFLNGQQIELVHFQGFPIKKEDAERLGELRTMMISKGLPRSEVAATLKLERRRCEKALAREKKQVCFKCRRSGHLLSECPLLSTDSNLDTTDTGVCFKCGSTEHTSFVCKVVKGQEFRFASCFICKEQGHISWQCPDNAKGLYPKGGACRLCGSVTHLKKDCPQHVAESESNTIALETIQEASNPDSMLDSTTSSIKLSKISARPNKIVKF